MPERPSQKALADFVAEAQEVVEALDRGLALLEDTSRGGEPDPDTLNAVFRSAHTLKGLAAMFGLERMASLAHALEDRLDEVRMGRAPLDGPCLGALLASPAIFTAILGEEAAGKPAATEKAATELAARLRQAASDAPGAVHDPIDDVVLDAAVRSVLTEYEEHRLRKNLEKGARLYRLRVGFDLATFDTGLDALKQRVKASGEVISTLPSAEPTDPEAIAFDVLVASDGTLEGVRTAAGPSAVVDEIPRRSPAPARPAAPPSTPAAPATAPRPPPPAAAPPPVAAPPPEAAPSRAPSPTATVRSITAGAAPARAGEGRLPASVGSTSGPDGEGSLRSASHAVRVDIHKLDRLMNLVGELVLVKSSLIDLAQRLRNGEESTTIALELHRETRSLERKLNELQGGVLEVRMVPLEQIFDKISRMVRKLARDLGKQVVLEVRGGEVELDKLIVEDLSDPLMHLIRNALDHGVEPPEARAVAGKPAAATLTVAAAQKGNHVVVSVQDDGPGIDVDRVRRVAVERGILSDEAVAQLTQRDAMNLIFLPGFSTAPEVTALSGRGVGLDVVKSNVAGMRGIIDLHTELGKGTRFEITLPVTLAILRALIVSAAGRTYAVPLNGVLEIVTVEASELRTVEQREVISLRGATLPLVRLGQFLGAAGAPAEGPLFVVVVGLAQDRIGIAVDALVGQQDIVLKPLGRALAGVRAIAGATDLGGRRTVLVLDVAAVIAEVVRGGGILELAD